MKILDLALPTPEANLACDEALLEWCERQPGEELLRFWEPEQPFVVLGHSNRAHAEVNLAVCRGQGIPILRRCSGGGAVVQGPGCLNYALILRTGGVPELQSVARTNAFIMTTHRDALAEVLRAPVEVQGITDLALHGLKFSGNAQRRSRHHLLFHGTFLLTFDLKLMDRLLPMPSRQPDYRRQRPHLQFVTNLRCTADLIRQALKATWQAREPLRSVPTESIERLTRERYSQPEWTFKY